MKEKYITQMEDAGYREFLAQYESLLSTFEQSIVPYLVQADI
jgi:hypothetical protein